MRPFRRRPVRRPHPVRPRLADRFGALDVVVEATSDLSARPMRLVLTLAGTVVGVAALVATLGLSQSAAMRVEQAFEAAAASHAVLRPVQVPTSTGESVPAAALPWDAPERMRSLSGVRDAAAIAEVPNPGAVSAVDLQDPAAAPQAPPRVMAASPGFLGTVEGRVVSGRAFDTGHDERADRVVLLGRNAAAQLGVSDVWTQPSIFLAGRPYAVLGVFDDTVYRGDLLDAVVLPIGTARADFGLRSADEVQVRLARGGGPIVSAQAPRVVAPDAPELYEVGAPAGPSRLQESVQADVQQIFLLLAIVVLVAGGLGIASVTSLSVLERTAEIGLRRALGATRRQVAAQFVVESAVLGSVGGIVGASVGVVAVVAVSLALGWAPLPDPITAIAGVLLGAAMGVVAGWAPARRAARIEPVDALRSA